MLRRGRDLFTTGRSRFADHSPAAKDPTAKIYVRVAFEQGSEVLAQVDTGAAWPDGMSFLGYSGLLDSLRFAVDPQANDFYFGLPAGS